MKLKINKINGNTEIKQFETNSTYSTMLILVAFMLIFNLYLITVSYGAIFMLVMTIPAYLNSSKNVVFRNKITVNSQFLVFEQGIFPIYFKRHISKSNFQFLEVVETEIWKKPVFLLNLFYEGKKTVLLKTMDITECQYVKDLVYKILNTEEK